MSEPVRIVGSGLHVRLPIFSVSQLSARGELMRLSTGGRIGRVSRNRVEIEAISGIDFEFKSGDRVGLLGANGSGKSTLLKTLAGIYYPSIGSLNISGSVATMFDLQLGFDPEATGRRNIYLRSYLLGMRHHEIEERINDIVEFADLGPYIDLPFKTYSSGMAMRLAFGLATSVGRDIVLMDEWVSAGDLGFQRKAEQRLQAITNQAEILVIASHSESLIRQVCNKALILDKGKVIDFDEPGRAIASYNRAMGVEVSVPVPQAPPAEAAAKPDVGISGSQPSELAPDDSEFLHFDPPVDFTYPPKDDKYATWGKACGTAHDFAQRALKEYDLDTLVGDLATFAYHRGQRFMVPGNFGPATQAMNDALSLESALEPWHSERAPQFLNILMETAFAYLRMKRLPEAKSHLMRALRHPQADKTIANLVLDTFMRHGMKQETNRVLGEVLRVDPENAVAKQLGLCWAAFDSDVGDLAEKVAATTPEDTVHVARKAIFALPIWGQAHVEKFLDSILPLMMANDNLPALITDFDLTVAVFTTKADWDLLCASERFESLQARCPVVFMEIDKLRVPGSDPNQNYLMLNYCHYACLSAAQANDGVVFFGFTDNFVSENFYGYVCRAVQAGAASVVCAGYRIDETQAGAEIAERLSEIRDNPGAGLSASEMSKTVVKYLPPEYDAMADKIDINPFFLYWRIDDEQAIVRASHFQPYALDTRCLKGKLVLRTDPLDAQFMVRWLSDTDSIHVVEDDRIMVYDLDKPRDRDAAHMEPRTKNVYDIAQFLKTYDTPLHRKYLQQPLRLGIKEDSDAFRKMFNESQKMINQVLAAMDWMDSTFPEIPDWAARQSRDMLSVYQQFAPAEETQTALRS